MLDSFRKASKSWIVKLLFALLVLSFLSWGVGDVIRGGLFGQNPAIEVGSSKIIAAEVEREFKRQVEKLQPLFGGKLTSDEARKLGLMDRTIESMVSRSLIEENSRRLGLAASDQAVLAMLATDPRLRNELGQFDKSRLMMTIARMEMSEKEFMRQRRQDIMQGQLAAALTSPVHVPESLVKPLVQWREEQRVAEIVAIRDDSVPAPAAPDAATVDAYYKANNAKFMAPEYRALTVLLLRPSDVAQQIDVTPAMVAEAYQARLDEFESQERRQVSQFVITSEEQAEKADKQVKEGKDLTLIAKELGLNIVDLGIIERGDLPDALAEAVFSANAGATTGPVKSPLGWHVAQVTKVQAGRTRTLDEVRAQLEQDVRRDLSMGKLSELANQVEDRLGSGASLEETATTFNLRLLKIPAIDQHGKSPSRQLVTERPKGDSFLDVAFHTAQGTESQMTDVEGEGYFLLRVDQIIAPQPRPLADIKSEIVTAWANERRHEQAEKLAGKMIEQVKAGKSLSELATSSGQKLSQSIPFTREGAESAALPPSLVSDLYGGPVGSVAMAPIPHGWMVARLSKVIPFDAAQNSQIQANALRKVSESLSSDLIDQYMAALNASVGVKVDRSQLAREE